MTADREALRRITAAGFISLLGVALFVPSAAHLSRFRGGVLGLLVAGLGSLIALVVVLGGYLLVREGFTSRHLLRIAGWAALGTGLLGTVLVLLLFSGVDLPGYAVATLLAVSTFAHVLIGVRDVQRIRAAELARQREQLAVLNRLVRHNLRHVAQRLLGISGQLSEANIEGTQTDVVEDIRRMTDDLTEMNDMLDRSRRAIDRNRTEAGAVDLAVVVEDVVADYRAAYPEATIDVAVPADCRVTGGSDLQQALVELVENAIVHASGTPRVGIEAETRGRTVALRVTDNGPGIPERERAVIMREAAIDQLTHSQGLGLWFVRWVMDGYGGDIRIESESDGTTITLELPRPLA